MQLDVIRDLGVTTGMVTLISKIIFDWLKGRHINGTHESVLICSLDRTGAIANIENTHKHVHELKDHLVHIENQINAGLEIARKGNEHYDDFLISLTTLQNVSKQTLEEIKNSNRNVQRQTELLIELITSQKKGGN